MNKNSLHGRSGIFSFKKQSEKNRNFIFKTKPDREKSGNFTASDMLYVDSIDLGLRNLVICYEYKYIISNQKESCPETSQFRHHNGPFAANMSLPDGKTVYHGETSCQARHSSGSKSGQTCTNKAYYSQGNKLLCGVHSKIVKRRKLPVNPRKGALREERLATHSESVTKATNENQAAGRSGRVICSRMGMMRAPDDVSGFLKVFPNFKHQNRKGGFGCMALSPKSLGPIHHGQKNTPAASCLENYHQFNKVFANEVDAKNNPTKKFYDARIRGYQSKIPQRHKFNGPIAKGADPKAAKRCLYSIHLVDGTPRRYNYIESRYFYCHFYEKLAPKVSDFAKLKEMMKQGTNLQIAGFDGYDVTYDLMRHYEDPRRPFGHELALYTLLTVDRPCDYPWNKYYQTHADIYPSDLAPHTSAAKPEDNEAGEGAKRTSKAQAETSSSESEN